MLRCGLPDKKSGNPRKSRERKRSKRLKRQQPERKEKYRKRQCRANRKQHHKLSKLSARHDMQRQRSETLKAQAPQRDKLPRKALQCASEKQRDHSTAIALTMRASASYLGVMCYPFGSTGGGQEPTSIQNDSALPQGPAAPSVLGCGL